MKLSLNLIKQFVDLGASATEIADKITLSLTEVEGIEKKGNDTIIEIENKALTHRPDCFSHLGMAREIAAYFNKAIHDPIQELFKKNVVPTGNRPFSVVVEAKELIPRYVSVVLTDIKIGPSPQWLSETLENVGIRSINNVVDITNYVMIELGQPMHAYDYDVVEGNEIIVRKAKTGEKLQTLDGTVHNLDESMIVIADKTKPLLLGGVMGGKDSEVSEKTTNIILEAATFNAIVTRRTSKEVNLRTEGSTRYEKNLDPNVCYPALMRAVELLKEYANGNIASETIDIQNEKRTERTMTVESGWINKFLGTSFNTKEISDILSRLNYSVTMNKTLLEVTVPTYRSDVTMPADIAEEVARISGYDKIPVTLPSHDGTLPRMNRDIHGRNHLKTILKSMGFAEVITSPFTGDELLKKTGISDHDYLELQNPLTVDQKYLRRSLFPSLLTVVSENLTRQSYDTMRIYEINKLFVPVKDKKEPLEPYYLSGFVSWNTGDTDTKISNFEFRLPAGEAGISNLFRYSKGLVESLMDQLHISDYSFKPYTRDCDMYNPFFHPNMTAQLYIGTRPMGIFGAIHPHMQTVFTLPEYVYLFDMHVDTLIEHASQTHALKPVPSHPSIVEDKTIRIEKGVLVGDVLQKIKSASPLISSVELVDTFEENYTFRITFQHPSRNLTDKEVQAILTQF